MLPWLDRDCCICRTCQGLFLQKLYGAKVRQKLPQPTLTLGNPLQRTKDPCLMGLEKQLEIPTRRDCERVVDVDPPACHYQEGGDARNYITQKQVDRNRSNQASSSQDFDNHSNNNYEPSGASWFTLNIRNSRMPKGFKLTTEIVKFDGRQDPRLWLEDYLIACNCQGGNQITAMQYLQLMLTRSAREWLQLIPKNSFSTWEEFEEAFVKNLLGTYSRPGTLVELKACKQHRGESLRAFIARWTLLRSSFGVVSEERAIEAF